MSRSTTSPRHPAAPRRPSRLWRLASLALLALLGLPGPPALAAGGDPPRPTPDPPAASTPAAPTDPTQAFEDSVSVSWVLVPVIVQSRWGYVDGLERKDFRLSIDGHPAPITDLDLGADAPLSVVYLQDLSGSMANSGKLEASRRALDALLDRARPGDELALASFAGNRLRVDVPFTESLGAVRDAMNLWEGYGTTALNDAVSMLPDISAGDRKGRRVAVLVTDGQDNASAIAPREALDLVRRARLPVYVIGLDLARSPSEEGKRSEEGTYRYVELLKSLAEGTGGRYFGASSPGDATAAVQTLVDDLRRRYILALATAGDGPASYHRLEVEVALPYRHTLTFRRGYFGTLPPSLAKSTR